MFRKRHQIHKSTLHSLEYHFNTYLIQDLSHNEDSFELTSDVVLAQNFTTLVMMKPTIIYQSSPPHSSKIINFLQFYHQPEFFAMQVYNKVCIEKLHMRVVGNVQSFPSFSSPLLLLINYSLIFFFLTIIS